MSRQRPLEGRLGVDHRNAKLGLAGRLALVRASNIRGQRWKSTGTRWMRISSTSPAAMYCWPAAAPPLMLTSFSPPIAFARSSACSPRRCPRALAGARLYLLDDDDKIKRNRARPKLIDGNLTAASASRRAAERSPTGPLHGVLLVGWVP